MKPSSSFVYLNVALIAMSTLLFELVQTRILSYIFWNHLVYLTVSIALLGFGISGTLVAILSTRHDLLKPRAFSLLWLGFGLSLLFAIGVTSSVLPLFPGVRSIIKLALCYLLYFTPFVFSGALLTLLLSLPEFRVGRLYATDLAASGLGCVLFFFLLPQLGAVNITLLLAFLAILVAFGWCGAEFDRQKGAIVAAGIFLAGLAGTYQAYPSILEFPSERYKEMGYITSGKYPNHRVVFTEWTPICRIDLVMDSTTSLMEYPEHPEGSYMIVTQDGSAHTRLLSKRAVEDLHEDVAIGRDLYPANLVYAVREKPDVAIIGVGGGTDVAFSLAYGAKSVVGVELNPATYNLGKERYAHYNGGFLNDPRVTYINGEGRSVLRNLGRKYDALQIIAIDTFAALSSGAYVLSENYLYTVEAFEDYFSSLKPDGFLAMYRWLFNPPRETLRLSTIACEMWRKQGVPQPESRIMVVGGYGWALSLFKNGIYTLEEVQAITAEAQRMGRVVLYFPKVLPPAEQAALEKAHYDRLVQKEYMPSVQAFNDAIMAYSNGTQDEFLGSYLYNVTPTTDDSPFYFEYHHLNFFGLPDYDGLRGEGVNLTMHVIIVEAVILSLLAIFFPLWRYQREGLKLNGALPFTLYFASLGFGFMVVEIALIQKLVLYLGNPLYSLPVVLATLLVSAGLGSQISSSLTWRFSSKVRFFGPMLFVLMVAETFLTAFLNSNLSHLELMTRMFLAALSLFPMGFVMGTFFPAGMQAVRNQNQSFLPWAWGINGCTSVFGSILAILLGMVHGFRVTLFIGALFYVLAVALTFLVPKDADQAI